MSMARRDAPSLRSRVFRLAALLLVVATGLLFAFVHDYANRASDRAFDRLLSASALTIAGAVVVEDAEVVLELPSAALAMVSGQDRLFYKVLGPTGAYVTGYPDLARDLPLAVSDAPVFHDLRHNGEAVRIVSVGRLVSTEAGTGWVTIRVAETRGARDALTTEIMGNAVLPIVSLAMLAMGMVWVVLGYALAPLSEIDTVLRKRSPEDLSPIDVPVPAEIQRLVGGLNGFMARLEQSSARLAGLVAEAAHQVRNPLASLRAQSEMALLEPDDTQLRDRVARIHDRAVEASHLVTQLLMDATITHRMDTFEGGPVSVAVLIDEVVDRLDADQRERVDVVRGAETDAVVLNGDRVALREMLRNLLDNALAYSNGRVEVGATIPRPEMLRLHVRDHGPGIAPALKARVQERFTRGEGVEGKIGSGLGLAIVRRVVEGHGGTLALLDRDNTSGLDAVVELPMPELHTNPGPVPGRLRHAASVIVMFALLATTPDTLRAQASFHPAQGAAETGRLAIAGTTDTELFSGFIAGFQGENPSVAIAYTEIDSLSLFRGFLDGSLSPQPDVLISSAADLQFKLANDGHALRHPSPYLTNLPGWAQWRGELFGFTYEPAVIIYNPTLVPPGTQPRSHAELAALLEREPERFHRRVATYDIARSGVGYLLASQDQQISSQFWRLAAAFGRVDAVLTDSSPEILDRVANGDFALGYNVLGSYAFARQAAGATIGIVVPGDYVLVLTRAALIPRNAPNPELARAFVDFVLSPTGQAIAAGPSALGAIIPGSSGYWTQERISGMGQGAVQPIALGPVLMAALDPQRRRRFLESWQEIVAPGTSPQNLSR
jgi:two-component system, OmpR family, sensor histidine kinase TctE